MHADHYISLAAPTRDLSRRPRERGSGTSRFGFRDDVSDGQLRNIARNGAGDASVCQNESAICGSDALHPVERTAEE
jgi:hypothetical protein